MQVGTVDAALTRGLRRAVLRPNLAPGEPLPGDDLPAGVHIGAIDDDGTVVGTCFVYRDACPWLPDATGAWHLRQMATDPGRRGEGIGAAVLGAAVEQVCERGGALIWCHARETAAGFYSAHGFREHGGVFLDAEHPIRHLRMWRNLREPSVVAASSEG
ncbi:MAG: GNAT family N-acetyltransferase [Jatrophihabitantaceae bacterium]